MAFRRLQPINRWVFIEPPNSRGNELGFLFWNMWHFAFSVSNIVKNRYGKIFQELNQVKSIWKDITARIHNKYMIIYLCHPELNYLESNFQLFPWPSFHKILCMRYWKHLVNSRLSRIIWISGEEWIEVGINNWSWKTRERKVKAPEFTTI